LFWPSHGSFSGMFFAFSSQMSALLSLGAR
jgi:hypothetical protein